VYIALGFPFGIVNTPYIRHYTILSNIRGAVQSGQAYALFF